MVDLKNIIEKRIYKEHQVRSINGLFFTVDESLEKTNYAPSYQRNYVWDDEKATYFIESIFLGTEVPPIIFFKSEDKEGVNNYEVIDGRQRYETIKRFRNNELKLKKSGLQRLGDLNEFVGCTFSSLKEEYQNLFKDTCIRTIVYSFIGEYKPEEEETVKREIFQRYNSGITPLRTYEIDKAQNYYNTLNQALKSLFENKNFDNKITRVFRWEKYNVDQKVIKIRELLVLHRIPINYYANKKQKVVAKYFEYISSQLEEEEYANILALIIAKIDILQKIEHAIIESGLPYNRLFAECIFWAISVMDQNNVVYDFSDCTDRLVRYLNDHKEDFTTVRSSFYKVLVGRYRSIASFFEKEYSCSFLMSIENNDSFRLNNKRIDVSSTDLSVKDKSFEDLRIKKPQPVSVRIPELIDSLKSCRFLIRPSYQRADVKNKKKSSSIIESLLLGIMLPPIFVYKRINGTSEVVDGQQRLLSIISYIGESYTDEKGEKQEPYLLNFKLDLANNAILRDLKGKSYSDLSKADQNKIRNSSIYLIEIKEENNRDFDPVDLFVRLNNKPYPIPADSFEMWNSFADRSIIDLVKTAVSNNSAWFYLRKNNAQMENENLFTTLAYFQYQYILHGNAKDDIVPEKTIETFVADKRLSCRFRARNEITKLLYNSQASDLIEPINHLQFSCISNIFDLLDGSNKNMMELNKSMDELLRVENGKRTQMVFYILWILFHDLSCDVIRENRKEIFNEFHNIYKFTDECTNVEDFKKAVIVFRKKYSRDYCSMHFPLGAFVQTVENPDDNNCLCIDKKPSIDNRMIVRDGFANSVLKDDTIILSQKRQGIDLRYIEAYLQSRLFFMFYKAYGSKVTGGVLRYSSVPFIHAEKQKSIVNLLAYVRNTDGSIKKYFERILDLSFYELYYPNAFSKMQIHVIREVDKFTDITDINDAVKVQQIINNVYKEHSQPSNLMSMYLLKAIDMVLLKNIEKSIEK